MSTTDEEPYSTIFASLKHPIRRRILMMLSKKPMSFTEMLEVLGVSSSFLTYHLESLGELVGKVDGGRYRLSSFGEAAIATMTKVEDIPITAPQQSPKTKSKRVVGRSVAIALGIICILLIACLGGAMAYYTMIINDTNSEENSLKTTINQLNATIADQTNRIGQLESNLTNLQNQVSSLEEPKLVEVNLTAEVNSTAEYNINYFTFHVFGYLCNVGTSMAYDCEFQPILYYYQQNIEGGVVEYIQGPISLGNVSGHSGTSLDWSVTQRGVLINWTVTPAWAGHTSGIIEIPGSPSPIAQGVYDGFQLTMTLEKTEYTLGEPIDITLTLTNISNQTISFGLDWSNDFDFQVYNGTNSPIYLNSWHGYLEAHPASFWLETLNAGESLSEDLSWQQTIYPDWQLEGVPVLPGTYYIVGQIGPVYYGTNCTIETTPVQITIV